jgi:hypothetical protein
MQGKGSMTTMRYPASESPDTSTVVSLHRCANDEIAVAAARFDGNDGSKFEFVCECGELSCRGLVEMTLAAYRASAPGSVVGH